MAKEWILNSVMNRFQLNFKRNVGAVSAEIRKCSPKSVDEWSQYYFNKVYDKNHIESLGKRLYIKITEVIVAEVEEVTEQDCINYMFNMVIERTFDGYTTEINTIYKQLQQQIDYKIEPASDKWDRLFNVDFFIKIADDKFIGLQIKPMTKVTHIPQIYKEKTLQIKTHTAFKKKFFGKVFYIFSIKKDNKKIIINQEVVGDIRQEIERLKKL